MTNEHDMRRLDVLIDPYDQPKTPLPKTDDWPMWLTIWCAIGGSATVCLLLGIGFLAGRLSLWVWP